jgi:hypothetical protein
MEQPARKTGRGSCTATTYRCCGRLALGRQSNHDASQNAVNQSRPVFERDTQKIASRLVSRDKRTQTRPADQFRINLRARRADRESEQQRQIRPRCRMGKLIIAWACPTRTACHRASRAPQPSPAQRAPHATTPFRIHPQHRPLHNQSHVRKIHGDRGSNSERLWQWCGCSSDSGGGHDSQPRAGWGGTPSLSSTTNPPTPTDGAAWHPSQPPPWPAQRTHALAVFRRSE